MRVSFDFGNTISGHPEQFKKWAEAIHKAGGHVYMITGVRFDATGKPEQDEIDPRNEWAAGVDAPIYILWARGDNAPPDCTVVSKAHYCVEHQIDVHVDNNKRILNEITKATNGKTLALHVSGCDDFMF